MFRPRRGVLSALNIETQTVTTLQETDGVRPEHFDTSPVDPTLMKFCWDGTAIYDQRIWAARTDGNSSTGSVTSRSRP